MKIVGYDNLSGALQIKFAGDTAEKTIDEYPAHDFSVLEMHENVSISEILVALAQNGFQIALQQELAEEISRNNSKTETYKSLINNEFEFSPESLFPQPEYPAPNQPISTGLMVV